MRLILLSAAALLANPAVAWAEDQAAPVPTLPALTPLKLAMVDGVSTRTANRGDRFAITLVEAVELPGIIIPAGTRGYGEVVHTQKAGAAGRAGELILAARCLTINNACLRLRSLRTVPTHATERTDLALAVGVAAGVVGFFISGGNREVPAGSALTALTAEATPWPSQPAPPTIQPREPK